MNCGREVRPVEVFTRSSLFMHKKPTVMYYLSGTPTWINSDCVNMTSLNNTDRSILDVDYKILVNSSTIMDDMTFLKLPGTSLYKVYESLAPMGQSVMPLLQYKCQGPYSADFSVKTTGSGAAWHPGRKGHILRAHSIVYTLLLMLDEALNEVQHAKLTSGHEEETLLLKTVNELASKHPPTASHLPPKTCSDTEECGNTAPKCYTEYLPRQGNSLMDKIIGQNDWSLNVSFYDLKGVETNAHEHRGYIDKKMVYISTTNKTALSFAIDLSRNSSIWLCELQRGFLNYPKDMGDLDKEATVYLYKNVATRLHGAFVAGDREMGKVMRLGLLTKGTASIPKGDQICFQTETVSKGYHVISIYQKGSKRVSISYLVYW